MNEHYPLAPQRPWTEQENEILQNGWMKGLTAGQIVLLLPGRTRNAVLGRVCRLRLADRPSPLPGRPRMPKEQARPVPKLPVREVPFVLLPEPAVRQVLADQAYMRAIACAAGAPRA